MAFFVGYFVLGLVRDFTATVWYRAVSERRVWLASHTGALLTALDIFVIAEIAITRNLWWGVAYTLGTWVGINAGMRMGKGRFQ